MRINCGIIGLPNVGKSTLFSVLAGTSVKVSNFPFCTIHPNIAIIQIPDSRLYSLKNIVRTRKIVNKTIEFIDIAGLIKGASQGEGLGNQILHDIQTVKILCHMVRCFDDDIIAHVEKNIDPCRDINIVNHEILIFDILKCEQSISSLQKKQYISNKKIAQKLIILKTCLNTLYKGIFLNKIKFSVTELEDIKEFNFLTIKPIIYIANLNENINNQYLQKLNLFGLYQNIPVISFYGSNHINVSLCQENNILHEITKHIFSLLKLNTFFTMNSNMIKSWINIIGTDALNSASRVHSDFKKGFIRVQVIKFNDFIKYQKESTLKKLGKIYYEGKNYCIEDGDILKFLFHV